MNQGQLDSAVQEERTRCLKCVEHCLDLPIHDPLMRTILYKIANMIRSGIHAGESVEVDLGEVGALDDTDPVYF